WGTACNLLSHPACWPWALAWRRRWARWAVSTRPGAPRAWHRWRPSAWARGEPGGRVRPFTTRDTCDAPDEVFRRSIQIEKRLVLPQLRMVSPELHGVPGTPWRGENEMADVSPWLQTVIGGLMTLAGGALTHCMTLRRERDARRHEADDRRNRQRADFQIKTLTELQDALCRIMKPVYPL